MKILRSQDVGGIPVASIHRLGQLFTQPTIAVADGLEIHPRVLPWRPLRYDLLVDAATLGAFTERWSQVEVFDQRSRLELSNDRASALKKARSLLRKGNFGDFIWPVALSEPNHRFAWLQEILLPAFFEEHPRGQVRLVRYDACFNSPLSLLNVLQRARILQTADAEKLQRFVGTSALSSLSFNVAAEALFYALSLGLAWTYPTMYGFVGTCNHEHFLLFVLDQPFTVDIDDATSFERMTPGLGNVMNTRGKSTVIVPQSYVSPERSYPLNREMFSSNNVVDFLGTYVEALGATFAWLADFDNFGKKDDPHALDVGFAQAIWLTVFVLVVTQFSILQSHRHFSRKLSYFDSLELLAALMTSAPTKQTSAWLTLASDAFSRERLVSALAKYAGGFGAALAAAVLATRAAASATVNGGLFTQEIRTIPSQSLTEPA